MSLALRNWLERIGLQQYAEVFASNDIDLDVLPRLGDNDLKDLGLSLGHRRKLQQALATLSAEPSPVPPHAPLTEDSVTETTGHEAERRQLTVLFCDLVGSTELSHRLDPEEFRELIRHYQDAVSGSVVRHGGYVANFQGDGIVAYFGWPQADEDEAAQAIRAGLDAIAMVRQLPLRHGCRLRARVGIASGIVVIGDLDAAGGRQPGAVGGDAPNLAARLQALAETNQAVIDGLTRQLVGAGFVLEELGPQTLKGFAEPVAAWRVLGERATESRFAAREGRLTPFVAREHELAMLIERFERAAAGEGQAVLLSGEAGIGKSRLVQTLCERLSAPLHTPMRVQCSPFHTTSTLYPVLRHLEYAAGFLPDDGTEARLSKLNALLRQATNDSSESLAALAPLFSLPVNDRYAGIALSAEQREKRALKALVDQLLGLAARSPVLFILEDAHSIDPATRELVAQALARVTDARMLMVITSRPESQTDWTRYPQLTALTLNRLSRGQGAEIARAAATATLSEEMVARILRRADGVPLFIEELTRSVVETGNPFGDSVVPETLQASLLARLDRLGTDIKQIAQIAAVIGREFSCELLCAVVGKPKNALAPALERLVVSQIALPTGPVEEDTYLFRHALIQDAAYQSLLLSRRRQYHGEIARALETRFAAIAGRQPELIAQHYTAATMPEQAIPYWVKAGERALARFAYQEPVTHFEQALQLARGLPEGPERVREILNVLPLLGDARLRNQQLQLALQMFSEMADLARIHDSPVDLTRAALGMEEAENIMNIPQRASIGVLEAALAALGEGETAERCRVLSRLGRALLSSGVVERAIALTSEATNLAWRLGDRRALLDALYCAEPAMAGHPWSARDFPTRRSTLDEMLAIADQVGQPNLILHSLTFSTAPFLEMGDLAAFAARLARLGELVEKHQIGQYVTISSGALRAILHGDFTAAERMAEQAFEASSEVHSEVAAGIYGVQMFTIRREQGRVTEVASLLRRFLVENPDNVAWRPGLALIASDLGFRQAAQKAFDEIADGGFALPIDAKRNITLCYLAEVCVRLRETDRAERLYELLLPYRDLAVVVAVATVCCGSTARYLGMLAGMLGHWTEAEEHFQAALDMDERLQAWPWLAHTKHEFALALRARDRAGDRNQAEALLAEAAASAERFSMASLQGQIRSLAH